MKRCLQCSHLTGEASDICPVCGGKLEEFDGQAVPMEEPLTEPAEPETAAGAQVAEAADLSSPAAIVRGEADPSATAGASAGSAGAASASGGVPPSFGARIAGLLRKRLTKALLIVILALAALGIAARVGYGYFLDRNPKLVYLMAESATLKAKKEKASALYREEAAFWRSLFDQSGSVSLQLRSSPELDVDGRFEDMAEVLNVFDAVGRITFAGQAGWDKEAGWSEVTLKLQEGRSTLADITLQRDQDYVYLFSESLFDVPVRWTRKQFEKAVFGIEEEPDSDRDGGETQSLLDSLKLTEEEKDKLGKWLRDVLAAEVTNQAFEIDEDASYSSPDGRVKLKKITLTLDELTLKKIFAAMIDGMRADEALRNMIVNRAKTLFDISKREDKEEWEYWDYYREYGDFADLFYSLSRYADEDGNFDTDAYSQALTGTLTELRMRFLENFTGEFRMEVFVNKKNVIVDRHAELSVGVYDNEENSAKFEWTETYWKDKQSVVHTMNELTMTFRDYGDVGSMRLYRDQTYKIEDKTGVIEGEAGITIRENGETVINLSADYEVREAVGGSGTSTYDIILNATSDGDRIRYTIEAERDKELKKNKLEQEIRVNAGIDLSNVLNERVKLSLDTTIHLAAEKGKAPAKTNVARGVVGWLDMSAEERNDFRWDAFERLEEKLEEVFGNLVF